MALPRGENSLPQPKIGPQLVEGQKYFLRIVGRFESGRFIFQFSRTKEGVHEKFLEANTAEFGSIPIAELKTNMLVLIFDETLNEAQRAVIIEEPNERGKMKVLSVDNGSLLDCDASAAYYIDDDYAKYPYETFPGVLDDLDFFSDMKILTTAIEKNEELLDFEFRGKVTGFTEDELNLPKFQLIALTKGGRINVNDVISNSFDSIFPSIGFPSAIPEKPWVGLVVSHERDGEIYLHIGDDVENFLLKLESKINCDHLPEVLTRTKGPKSIEDVKMDQIYIAPYEGFYYRAKRIGKYVVAKGGEACVRMLFIDYGNKDDVPITQVREAKFLHPQLERIPPMGHRVYLKYVEEILNKDEFEEEVDGKLFDVDVRSGIRNGSPIVTLLRKDVEDVGQRNFNKYVVTKNVCRYGKVNKV